MPYNLALDGYPFLQIHLTQGRGCGKSHSGREPKRRETWERERKRTKGE